MNKDRILKNIQSIGKPKQNINKLTDMKCSSKGNYKALCESYKNGMMEFDKFDELYDQITEEEYDGYYIAADMINHFMLTHPKLKSEWNLMSADERWNFVEAIHYGIESYIIQKQ